MKVQKPNLVTNSCFAYLQKLGCKDVPDFLERQKTIDFEIQNEIDFFLNKGCIRLVESNGLQTHLSMLVIIEKALKECYTQIGYKVVSKYEIHIQKELDFLSAIKSTLELHLHYVKIYLKILHNLEIKS